MIFITEVDSIVVPLTSAVVPSEEASNLKFALTLSDKAVNLFFTSDFDFISYINKF